jgi:two-component system, cell cycle response regulator
MSATEQATGNQLDYVEEPTERQRQYDAPQADNEHFVLTIIKGNDAGALIELSEPSYVLGRARGVDIRIDCNNVSRLHARLTRRGDRFSIEDLGSRNGTWVEGTRLFGPITLNEGQRITIGDTVLRLAQLGDSELASARAISDAARKDPLTGCFNRGYFDQRLSAEVARAQRHGRSTALVLIDLDHFKRINDKYGHAAGDAVLQAVGQTLRDATRVEDLVARYGGEELALIIPGATLLGAALLAQRVRIAIAQLGVQVGPHILHVSASLGVAAFERGQPGSAKALLRAADDALYAAKRGGRNRVNIGTVDPSAADDTPHEGMITVTVMPEPK